MPRTPYETNWCVTVTRTGIYVCIYQSIFNAITFVSPLHLVQQHFLFIVYLCFDSITKTLFLLHLFTSSHLYHRRSSQHISSIFESVFSHRKKKLCSTVINLSQCVEIVMNQTMQSKTQTNWIVERKKLSFIFGNLVSFTLFPLLCAANEFFIRKRRILMAKYFA